MKEVGVTVKPKAKIRILNGDIAFVIPSSKIRLFLNNQPKEDGKK